MEGEEKEKGLTNSYPKAKGNYLYSEREKGCKGDDCELLILCTRMKFVPFELVMPKT